MTNNLHFAGRPFYAQIFKSNAKYFFSYNLKKCFKIKQISTKVRQKSNKGINKFFLDPIIKDVKQKNTLLLPNSPVFLRPFKNSFILRPFSSKKMTHTDEKGKLKMVDVGGKEITRRTATAVGVIHVGPLAAKLIEENNLKKGDAISVAKLAGIMAAKKTSDLIPLCHNISLNDIQVEATLKEENVVITATVECDGKTGVEMEALTAVTVAALTVYDMCKAVTHDMCIKDIKLIKKTGGSRGDFNSKFCSTD